MKKQLEDILDANLPNAEKTEEDGVTHYTVGKIDFYNTTADERLAELMGRGIKELLEALKELREAVMAENDGFSRNLELAMDGADEMITKHGEKL